MYRIELKFKKKSLVFCMEDIYNENEYVTPIILIIAGGEDPMNIEKAEIYEINANKTWESMEDFVIHKFKILTRDITEMCKEYYEYKTTNN